MWPWKRVTSTRRRGVIPRNATGPCNQFNAKVKKKIQGRHLYNALRSGNKKQSIFHLAFSLD